MTILARFNVTRLIERWYQRPIFFIPLLPLTACYWLIATVRRACYRRGWLRQTKLACPVIVVGNIEVAGSGKTPTTIALANRLVELGYKPGIVTRGYGGDVEGMPQRVDAAISGINLSKSYGDEAVLMAHKTNVPVIACRDRVRAGQYCLAHYDVDVILADDGLQHYALARDIEIALSYQCQQHRNKWLLPSGPFRESQRGLDEVDFVWRHGEGHDDIIFTTGLPYVLGAPERTVSWESVQAMKLIGLAGIAKPERFYMMLAKKGIVLSDRVEVRDHGTISFAHLNELTKTATVIMTEKDAVKYHPQMIQSAQRNDLEQCLVVPLETTIREDHIKSLLVKLQAIAKLF